MVNDAVEKSREAVCVAEHAVVDDVEDCGKLGIELVVGVEVGVAELFDVLCEVAEEEDILVADFASDLNL